MHIYTFMQIQVYHMHIHTYVPCAYSHIYAQKKNMHAICTLTRMYHMHIHAYMPGGWVCLGGRVCACVRETFLVCELTKCKLGHTYTHTHT